MRYWIPLGGIIFHSSTEIFMGIAFRSVIPCYIAFYDWHSIFGRLKRLAHRSEVKSSAPPLAKRRLLAIFIVGGIFFLTNVIFGFKKIDKSWPFAAYPFFDYIKEDDRFSTLSLSVKMNSSETVEFVPLFDQKMKDRYGTIQLRFIAYQMNKKLTESALHKKTQDFWYMVSEVHKEFQNAEQVVFYQSIYSIIPERANENPVDRHLLYEMKLSSRVNQ